MPIKRLESVLIKKGKKAVEFVIYPLDRTVTIHLELLSVPKIVDLKNLMTWIWFSPSLSHQVFLSFFFSFLLPLLLFLLPLHFLSAMYFEPQQVSVKSL